MQGSLKRMAPENIEDVIASIALYRPGPLQSGMDETFVECKKDPSLIQYKHPKFGEGPQKHLWFHRLSGTGDADCTRAVWLFSG